MPENPLQGIDLITGLIQNVVEGGIAGLGASARAKAATSEQQFKQDIASFRGITGAQAKARTADIQAGRLSLAEEAEARLKQAGIDKKALEREKFDLQKLLDQAKIDLKKSQKDLADARAGRVRATTPPKGAGRGPGRKFMKEVDRVAARQLKDLNRKLETDFSSGMRERALELGVGVPKSLDSFLISLKQAGFSDAAIDEQKQAAGGVRIEQLTSGIKQLQDIINDPGQSKVNKNAARRNQEALGEMIRRLLPASETGALKGIKKGAEAATKREDSQGGIGDAGFITVKGAEWAENLGVDTDTSIGKSTRSLLRGGKMPRKFSGKVDPTVTLTPKEAAELAVLRELKTAIAKGASPEEKKAGREAKEMVDAVRKSNLKNLEKLDAAGTEAAFRFRSLVTGKLR